MPKVTFADNLAILNNPDRGPIMEPRFLYSTIASFFYRDWDDTYGELDSIWFDGPIYIHEVGRVIKWMRNGLVIGEATVHSWEHDFNVIVRDVVGEFGEAGDLLINHDLNTFNYMSEFITWKELEPTEGVYDWAYVDAKVKKDFCIANNKKIIISFCMDYPSLVDHRDIPDWLYTAIGGASGGAVYSFDEVGNLKKGFSPDYTKPVLIAKHALAIAAIKNHFGNLIQGMEIGSIGHWGEFHTWPQTTGIGSMPPNIIAEQYIQHYIDNFDITQLGIRRPFDKATDAGIGIYYQMMGGPANLYEPWGLLSMTANGYTDEYGFTHKAYPNFRASSPVSGEHDPYIDDETWEADFSNAATGRNYVRTVQMSRDLEISRLRSHPEVHLGRIDGVPVAANAKDFNRRLGYRFVLNEFEYAINGANLNITVKIENKGFARCYKDYPVFIEFYDLSNNFIKRENLNISLKTIMRETTATFTRTVPYPTCDKITFKIEGVELPITVTKVADSYLMFNQHLDGPVADIPIGTAKFVKGGEILEPVSLYATDANTITDKSTRVSIGSGVAIFDIVAINDPDASAIRISTSSGIKSIKK